MISKAWTKPKQLHELRAAAGLKAQELSPPDPVVVGAAGRNAVLGKFKHHEVEAAFLDCVLCCGDVWWVLTAATNQGYKHWATEQRETTAWGDLVTYGTRRGMRFNGCSFTLQWCSTSGIPASTFQVIRCKQKTLLGWERGESGWKSSLNIADNRRGCWCSTQGGGVQPQFKSFLRLCQCKLALLLFCGGS